MQHKMLELEIGLKIGLKTSLGIENKGFQFPQMLARYHKKNKNIQSKLFIQTRYYKKLN
jgi:hypothetical protein